MNIVDACILLLLVAILIRSIKLGFVSQACSAIGFFGGLFLGALLQGLLVRFADSPESKALLGVSVMVASTIALSVVGEIVGLIMRARLSDRRNMSGVLDKSLAFTAAVVAFLIGVWLTGSVLSNIPKTGVQRLVQGSFILAHINRVLPPVPGIISQLGHLIDPNAFPDVFTGLEPKIDTTTPLPSIGELDPAVAKVRASVVKIGGLGCGGVAVGSGFVVDKDLVMTNAHVVAGVERPVIIDGKGEHSVTVVLFDQYLDVAVLRTSNLGGNPIEIVRGPVPSGSATAVLGYPGGDDFAAHPAAVIRSFTANGWDIYGQSKTRRVVHSLRADIEKGNSGGPLINKEGKAVGLIFAESAAYDGVGYALTAEQISDSLDQARSRMTSVSTGRRCAQ